MIYPFSCLATLFSFFYLKEEYPLELLSKDLAITLYPVIRQLDPLWAARQGLVHRTLGVAMGSPYEEVFLSIAFRIVGRPTFFEQHFHQRLPFPGNLEDINDLGRVMQTKLKEDTVFTGRYQHCTLPEYLELLRGFSKENSPWMQSWEVFDSFSPKQLFEAVCKLKFIHVFFGWQVT